MRNLIVVVLLLCLLILSGCESVSAWAWEDEGVGARIGTKITENNEVGMSAVLWEEDCEPRVLGIYGVRHFPEPVQFRNPLMLDFLPETLQAKAYLGGKLDYNSNLNDTTIGPIAGIILEDILFIEYQYQSFDPGSTTVDSKVLFGLRMEF